MDDLQYTKIVNAISEEQAEVLNLVINGWPSILWKVGHGEELLVKVLNLVINGWPSIL